MTLLETVVALAVIALGVLGIARGFITIAEDGAIAQQRATLEAIAADATSQIREMTYTPCASPTDYQSGLPSEVTVTSVSTSAPGSLSRGASDETITTPISCPRTHTADYGEEEITIRVCSVATCLPNLTVWKGDA